MSVDDERPVHFANSTAVDTVIDAIRAQTRELNDLLAVMRANAKHPSMTLPAAREIAQQMRRTLETTRRVHQEFTAPIVPVPVPPTPLDGYGNCPRCGKRLIPDRELPELVSCVDDDCAWFEPNGKPIRPQVAEV